MVTVKRCKKKRITYNSGYSRVVTQLTTNPPVRCLNRAEQTGSLIVSRATARIELKFRVNGMQTTESRNLLKP